MPVLPFAPGSMACKFWSFCRAFVAQLHSTLSTSLKLGTHPEIERFVTFLRILFVFLSHNISQKIASGHLERGIIGLLEVGLQRCAQRLSFHVALPTGEIDTLLVSRHLS